MQKVYFFFFLMMLLITSSNAQNLSADTRYLEDQFYMGITYNLLLNKPSGVEQRNLPYGLQLGYIKDIPVNKANTIGLGVGFGYAINNYYTNIIAEENVSSNISYIIDEGTAKLNRSKVATHLIELPFEFRWRNSTIDEYKFWRVYMGAKLGYVFNARSKLVTEDEKISFSNDDVKNIHYGLTLNFGYNTWNIQVYYQLNNLFNDGVVIEDTLERVNVRPLRIGIIFYIL